MSRCGYFSVFKGKITCNHPEHGKVKTQCIQVCGAGGGWHPCDICKMICGGIYPSEVPRKE